jgi:hypothetical protein
MRPGYGSHGPSKVDPPPEPPSGFEDRAWTLEEQLAQGRRQLMVVKRMADPSSTYLRATLIAALVFIVVMIVLT